MMNILSRGLNQCGSSLIRTSYENKLQSQLKKLFPIQSKTICHKDDLDPEQVALRLPPFPYKEKRINFFHHYFKLEGFHPTLGKFTENTKVLVVEGNTSSGKEPLAKKLADDMGMAYFPDITPEMDYRYDEDGWDFRDLNIYLHEDVKFPDFKSILETRNPYQIAYWEIAVLRLRVLNYLRALTHLLNTGDGVVIERSPWSGTVFTRTMVDMNLLSFDYLQHYWEVRSVALSQLLRPHVVIYIDVPVDKCLENARKTNKYGAGELLQEDYMEAIETNYKKHYLPQIEKHAELFTYKLDNVVTDETATELSEVVVDDLSRSDMDENFMRLATYQEKFDDWKSFDTDERFQNLRVNMTRDKTDYLTPFLYYPYYVDELWPSYSLLFARGNVYFREQGRREKRLYETKSFKEKLFPPKPTLDEIETRNWLLKTGYCPDHVVGSSL